MSELKKELSIPNDENSSRRMSARQDRFQEISTKFQVSTVTGQEWTGIKNGKLLEKAQQDFDIFVTIDQNLPYQQELSEYSIAIVALKVKSNRYKDLLGFVEPVSETFKTAEKSKFYEVASSNE